MTQTRPTMLVESEDDPVIHQAIFDTIENQIRDREPAETAATLEQLARQIYEFGRATAEPRGIIVADTKFEFGWRQGELLLIDEVLTPDSSRFWAADAYAPGRGQPIGPVLH